ncbi:MAG: arsenate reductase ArsC [Bacteroidota bacterium]
MRKVLIVCTGNSCRSQMAEGWLRTHGKGIIEAFSAGTHPSIVHPLAIKVMGEAGVDISKQRSKSVEEFIGKTLDYVITVCDNARESCPVLPGRHMIMHLPFDDPAGFEGTEEQRLNEFRRVRNLIGNAMREFVVRSNSVRD